MSTELVGVLGAGAMGAGIAQVALSHGHPVVLIDNDAQALARAKTNMQHAIQREIEKGRLQPKAASYELEATEHLDALKPAGLVIEAIVERIDAKHAAFRAMSGLVADDCVLATNTSSLSIASIASAASIPERVLGVHFFNPAPVLPLVEIVP